MKTAVVILNWNTRNYLKRWLPGLLDGDSDVWVADNASTDGSIAMVETEFPEVKTMAFDQNYGFTGGYNRAIHNILSSKNYEYIVLVNSDIDVGKGWLEPLESWMESHPECGVCGPKLLAMGKGFSRTDYFEYAGAAGGLLDRFGYPFCRGRVLSRTEKDSGQYDRPQNVLWISGACMMTRASLWRSLGGLDERFFAHMEEIDFCWRAQLAGWKITVVPQSAVWHLGGGTLPQTSPFKLKLNFRNNILLLDNNLKSTFIAMGMTARRASAKAKIRISTRRTLDLMSALVYLASGRKDCFKAIIQARKEADELLKDHSGTMVAKMVPDGLFNLCILPITVLSGKNIFKYLRKYENSHCRCR